MKGKLLIENVRRLSPEAPCGKIWISDGVVRGADAFPAEEADGVLDAKGAVALPGLVDVHVHFREPGFSYKETIRTGSQAAAAGGFTTVCTMPNLKPAPDALPTLREQLDIIDRDACIEVLPYATITRGRLGEEPVDFAKLAPYVCGFSDDGSGIQTRDTMLRAMTEASRTGKVVAEHCEVMELVRGGCIHDGAYSRAHNLPGICSESEWREVKRNVELAALTGCRLHICHVSTRESLEIIRAAKADGLNVTAETGAHYLAFCDDDLRDLGRFKMNPPLRTAADREALLLAVEDGTIDCIASDHAPHAANEKDKGLLKSAMGVTGLEVSFAAAYTHLVLDDVITLERLTDLMSRNPRKIFGIKGGLDTGGRADIVLVDLDREFTVDPATFRSMGKATPFEGDTLTGKPMATVAAGKVVYLDGSLPLTLTHA